MLNALQRLHQKGVRYRTIIDVGAADGSLSIELLKLGIAADAVLINIDANRLYENSLKEIASVLGGHYRICAISDFEGEIEMTMSAHPYWSSISPTDDPYWKRINGLTAEKVKVPTTTLDRLAQELSLEPPFLLKLDVQGAEESVLRGASEVLANTHVVVCEADINDFEVINKQAVGAGLRLYELALLSRHPDGTLGWFYPIYISRSLDFVLPTAFWDEADNASMIAAQETRRRALLENNAQFLNQVRLGRVPSNGAPESRNAPCSCGSGKRYKHCCGAHA